MSAIPAYSLFALAGAILLLGFLGEYVFSKTNIPDVIWLMLVGIIIGAFFKEVVHNSVFTTIGPIFTTFALIFILFEGAININIKQLIQGITHGTNLAIMSFILSMVAVSIVMVILGWNLGMGLLLGSIIGGTSSAIVIPITKRLQTQKKTEVILTIESAISDVLCIVGAVTIIDILELSTIEINTILQSLIYSFSVAIIFGALGGILWIKIQTYIEKFNDSYVTTIAFLLILYAFVEYLESNGAIAALAFGIVMGNSKRIFSLIETDFRELMSAKKKFFYSEISFFVKSFFFVYIGLIINFSDWVLILVGFMLSLVLIVIRPLAVKLTAGRAVGDKDKRFIETLAPKGLAAAVLAQVPVQFGFPLANDLSTIVLSVIFFSIIFSTVLVFMAAKGWIKVNNKEIEKKE